MPENVASWQSLPWKSASIRVACATPILAKVPRHPRGELYSPWVLICEGAVLPGVKAVAAVVSMTSHACCERMVVVNVWRFVWGTTLKVQVVGPVVGGGAPGSPGLT